MSHLVMVLSKQQWPRLSLMSLEFHLCPSLVCVGRTGPHAGAVGAGRWIAGLCVGCRARNVTERSWLADSRNGHSGRR
jgi:hypothetical protein